MELDCLTASCVAERSSCHVKENLLAIWNIIFIDETTQAFDRPLKYSILKSVIPFFRTALIFEIVILGNSELFGSTQSAYSQG